MQYLYSRSIDDDDADDTGGIFLVVGSVVKDSGPMMNCTWRDEGGIEMRCDTKKCD
jgi:hypothetical protein